MKLSAWGPALMIVKMTFWTTKYRPELSLENGSRNAFVHASLRRSSEVTRDSRRSSTIDTGPSSSDPSSPRFPICNRLWNAAFRFSFIGWPDYIQNIAAFILYSDAAYPQRSIDHQTVRRQAAFPRH